MTLQPAYGGATAPGSIPASALEDGVVPTNVRRGASTLGNWVGSYSWGPSTTTFQLEFTLGVHALAGHFVLGRSLAGRAHIGVGAAGTLSVFVDGTTMVSFPGACIADGKPRKYRVGFAPGVQTLLVDGVEIPATAMATGFTHATGVTTNFISENAGDFVLYDVRLIDPASSANTAYFPLDGLDAAGKFPNEHPGSTVADATVTGNVKFVPVLSADGGNPVPLVPAEWLQGTGDSSTVTLGLGAGDALTTGTNSVAVGKNALGAVNTGSGNVAVGYLAGSGLTAAANNVAIGLSALTGAAGASNVAVGPNALENSTGNNNVGVGYRALIDAASSQNVAIGSRAADALSSGTNTVAVGYDAVGSVTSGSGNTGVGHSALVTTTSTNNTALGNGSGSAITTGGANTFLGRFTGVGYETVSNSIYISDGSGNLRIRVNSLGEVFLNLPTSAGTTGSLWNDGGTVKVS